MNQKEKEFVNILNIIVEESIPGDINLWPKIQTQLKTRPHPLKPFWYWPTTRLGRISLTFILGLMFSSVAYATGPILSQLFQIDPGLQHVEKNNLVQSLNLSQTIDGITITVEQAYADTNRISVGFTLVGPEGRRFDPENVRLTHLPDTDLPSAGVGDSSGSGYLLNFDATTVQDAPRQLDLQFVVYAVEQYGLSEVIPEDKTPENMAHGKGNEIGPFVFNFNIPFLPSQTLSIQQTVETSGIQVRLEEVSITPSVSQATLCVTPPLEGEAFTGWIPITELDTGEGAPMSTGASTMLHQAEHEFCYRLIFPYPLADQPGQWSITVTELVGFHKTDTDKQMRSSGPWVFQFDVP